jgi:hypothetical protein
MNDVVTGVVSTTTSAYQWTNTTNQTLPFDASCYGTFDPLTSVDISIRIYIGATLVFVAVGLVGNFLSMLVFSSRDMQSVSSNVYLLTLAASDSTYLVSVFLSKTLHDAPLLVLPGNGSGYRQPQHGGVRHLAVPERPVLRLFDLSHSGVHHRESHCRVSHPTRFKELCTVNRARGACALIFVVISGTIAPYHVVSIGIWPGYSYCAILPQHEQVFYILYVVEMFLYRLVPVGVIATLNALIISPRHADRPHEAPGVGLQQLQRRRLQVRRRRIGSEVPTRAAKRKT